MNYMLRPLFVLLLLTVAVVARGADVTALRSWRAPDNTRLVLELSAPVQFRISADSTPAQLVLEIDDSQSLVAAPHLQGATGPVRRVHFETRGKQLLLLIDLGAEVNPKAFQLPPNEKYGQRLVVDIFDRSAPAPVAALTPAAVPASSGAATIASTTSPVAAVTAPSGTVASTSVASTPATALVPTRVPVKPLTTAVTTLPVPATQTIADKTQPPAASGVPARLADSGVTPVVPFAAVPDEPVAKPGKHGRNIIIAIDAGHGGEDPGAIGLHGSYEKNVTLAIARELYAQLKAAPGITPFLTRDGDYFIPLQDRRQIARYKDHADIFISVHADSSPARSAKGASVFALSLKGADTATSRFARMLAERENRADLIGGVALQKNDDEDSVLRNVLADMVVTGSLEHSLHMARNILDNLDHVSSLHSDEVEQAGFAVLKEPGMVSLLVETGFISNPSEEKRLTSPVHQHEIAHAIFEGALRYCRQYPAPGSYFAWLADKGRGVDDTADADSKSVDGKGAADGKLQNVSFQKTLPDQPATVKPVVVKTAAAKPRLTHHRIKSGESLTVLASRYQTTPRNLKELNGLDDDNVRIGQVIMVPAN